LIVFVNQNLPSSRRGILIDDSPTCSLSNVAFQTSPALSPGVAHLTAPLGNDPKSEITRNTVNLEPREPFIDLRHPASLVIESFSSDLFAVPGIQPFTLDDESDSRERSSTS
jgi:hypothetical protein